MGIKGIPTKFVLLKVIELEVVLNQARTADTTGMECFSLPLHGSRRRGVDGALESEQSSLQCLTDGFSTCSVWNESDGLDVVWKMFSLDCNY